MNMSCFPLTKSLFTNIFQSIILLIFPSEFRRTSDHIKMFLENVRIKMTFCTCQIILHKNKNINKVRERTRRHEIEIENKNPYELNYFSICVG